MKFKSKHQMSETFTIGAILAVVGGYLDAYTYISRGEVFANAQTGNIMFLAMNLASGDPMKSLSYVPPIVAFVVGIMISEAIKKRMDGGRIHWRQYVLLLELAVIVAVSFLPLGTVNGVKYNTISNVLISFVCSLQVQSFRKIRGIVCATTMCTGNLRSGTECLSLYNSSKDKTCLHKAVKFYGIVLFFIIGAVISTFVTNALMEKSVIFCAVGLIAAILIMFIEPSGNNK